jgi:hypothetical protein
MEKEVGNTEEEKTGEDAGVVLGTRGIRSSGQTPYAGLLTHRRTLRLKAGDYLIRSVVDPLRNNLLVNRA